MDMFKRILPRLMLLVASLALGATTYRAAVNSNAADLYKSKCSMCHGLDGKGYTAIHTPNFTSPKWQAAHTDGEITKAIEDGVKGTSMPAWRGKLTSAQVHDLVGYIRSLGAGKK
jgi:cbb3-type cytochrome c oxidase subunit III